jgi:hypothetical protein
MTAAASVSARVRAAYRGRSLLVALESAVIGASAGIAALAAAIAGRAEPRDAQTIALLALVATLGAVSWWLERRAAIGDVARAIDARADWHGALTTAFESEARADASPVAALLARRLAPSVPTRRFLGGEARSSSMVLAAPFLAAAFLGAVSEGRSAAQSAPVSASSRGPARGPRGSAPGALSARAEDLRAEAERLAALPGRSPEEEAALRSLAEEAQRLAAQAGRPETPLARLEGEAAELARRIEALRGATPEAGVATGDQRGTMGGPESPVDAAGDGSMRDTPPSSPPADARPGTPPAPGSGVGASRWWPERYDAIVERWVEARRAAAGGRPR